MKIPEYDFSKDSRKDTALVDFINDITSIVNLGRYQMRVVSSVPTWVGEEGEHLIYVSGTIRRLYWYDITNSTWQFIEWNASGLGQVTIAASISLTAQGSAIAITNLYTPPIAGLYRVNVYQICTTAGAGTLSTTITWTDDYGVKTVVPAVDVDLSSVGSGGTGNILLESRASENISYTVTIAGLSGSPKYSLFITVEKLN